MTTLGDSTGDKLRQTLKEVFGFSSFRPFQEEIVRSILEGRDAFVVMPTGGGKSLCYQLPAHTMPGTCMVVSPLISLMKDQVDGARESGLRAEFLNSTQAGSVRSRIERELLDGQLDLIYVSPERFAMEGFVELLKKSCLSFVAVDEAHCISEWGNDFRPDYLNLSRIVTDFPAVPVAAFTATATLRVQGDIIQKLGLRKPHVVRASFNRPNLFYRVAVKQDTARQILAVVRAHPGEAGIVYRTTRKSVEETAAMLQTAGVRALPYHAGLDDAVRTVNQERFNQDEVDVVVATIAFGMGIDKSNVRYIIHGDLPKNLEGYYQETGRSGRDGSPAECLLLFGYGDIPKIRYFIDKSEDEADRQHASRCLNDMIQYATLHACRRRYLLNYFGEKLVTGCEPNLGQSEGVLVPCCDVCSGEVEKVDGTRDAQIVLSAVARTGEQFGAGHIVDVVCGADTERVRRHGHQQVKTFGAGRDRDKRHWRFVIDNLLAQEALSQSEGQYPVLRLGAKARSVLFEGGKVHMLVTRKVARRAAAKQTTGSYDVTLFERLRGLRKSLAAAQGVPPYVVFSDRTLQEMARTCPDSREALLGVSGVGETKWARYGRTFLSAIREFTDARDSRIVSDVSVSS